MQMPAAGISRIQENDTGYLNTDLRLSLITLSTFLPLYLGKFEKKAVIPVELLTPENRVCSAWKATQTCWRQKLNCHR